MKPFSDTLNKTQSQPSRDSKVSVQTHKGTPDLVIMDRSNTWGKLRAGVIHVSWELQPVAKDIHTIGQTFTRLGKKRENGQNWQPTDQHSSAGHSTDPFAFMVLFCL